jgi:hypothetical protein
MKDRIIFSSAYFLGSVVGLLFISISGFSFSEIYQIVSLSILTTVGGLIVLSFSDLEGDKFTKIFLIFSSFILGASLSSGPLVILQILIVFILFTFNP